MPAPEGYKELWAQSKPLTPEELEAKKAAAMQRAVERYGVDVELEEGYEILKDETGAVYIYDGPVFVPKTSAAQQQRTILETEAYWGIRDRRNLCDQEYVGPRDIM